MNLQGQVAVITGGGSGLGAGAARVLAKAGARLALLDVNAAGTEALAAELGGLALRCDVTDGNGAEAALKVVAEKLGPPRVLVNCAGIGPSARVVGREGPHPLELYRKVIEVNLIGTFNMMRLAAAAMQTLEPLADGERGVIVSTASVAAFEGQIGQAAYASSKGGVVALTLPAARELARFGIRVMTIAPGTFETPMLATISEEYRKSLAAQVPFPSRLGRPEEFGALVRHICESPMLNGETIRLDGAIRMGPK
ncbi:MAG: SDR family NAD(P)-dependent oxidoreductase [Alphaproteobacteria bacterium]|nr:SDR family NAD(P)-dependent oxidoreductase [Alphaproteobacteria bacterium]